MLLTNLSPWIIFGGICLCLGEGRIARNTQVCNLHELEHYPYIHCFDRNHVPIYTVIMIGSNLNDGTKCLVSCNHERAFSTWKACVDGEWIGSDLHCNNIRRKGSYHSRQKRWWWSGGGGDKTPPDITCPSSKTVYADYRGRAHVWYSLPTATDGGSHDGVTMMRTSGIESGSWTGVGTHMICYKAKDKSDNESKQCCFYVYVKECTAITRCQRLHCTTSSNQICQRCDPGYHPEGNRCEPTCRISHCQSTQFECVSDTEGICSKCIDDDIIWKRVNNSRACAAMCSVEENRECWPGTCRSNGLASNCRCNIGFLTKKNTDGTIAFCQLEKKPVIETCSSSLMFDGGEIVMSKTSRMSTSCDNQQDAFINKTPRQAKFASTETFSTNITSPRPEFIQDNSWNYGLSGGQFVAVHRPLNGLEQQIEASEFKNISSNNLKSLDHQMEVLQMDRHLLLTEGDAICLRFISRATGFFKTEDTRTDKHIISEKKFNGETQTQRDVCFWYDSLPPDHCLNSRSCLYEPIQIPERITKNNKITISLSGWFDPTTIGNRRYNSSGIKKFDLSIHKVPHTKGVLKPDTTSVWKKISELPMLHEVQLNESGLYEIHLEVVDNAGEGGNVRSARRFILFDNSSEIKIKHNKPLLVTTAHIENGKYWQTEIKDICVNWTERFYNTYHITNNVLLPIKHSDAIVGVFEQLSGPLPIHGTLNIHGIVKFEYSYMINNGSSSQRTLVNQLNQFVCSNINITDGDVVQFRIHSMDIMNNTFMDYVAILIDTSVPDIDNIWLQRNRHGEIYVHNSKELSKMKLYFDAFDWESGLKSIHWYLGTSGGGSELSNGTIGVNSLSKNISCDYIENCYCPKLGLCEFYNYSLDLSKIIKEGQHNREYYFTIVVTNTAGLRSVQHLDVLVDESPPVNGTVMEGRPGERDVDFTAVPDITVNWNGFIDHESGLSHYEVFLGNDCLRDFMTVGSNSSFVIDKKTTSGTFLSFKLPKKGYFVFTVIAYNNALEPSEGSCSDGIFYEEASNIIHNISSENFNVDEGIACFDETSWLITSKLKRIRLGSFPRCMSKCQNVSFPPFLQSLSEVIMHNTNDSSYAEGICSKIDAYKDRTIFISATGWQMSWDVSERQRVQDIEIGIGSDKTSISHPDLKPYALTILQTRHRFTRDGVASQEKHYVFLKTAFKSGVTNILAIGPLIIDTTPPSFKREFLVSVEGSYVFLGWSNDTFVEPEQENVIDEIFFRIGTAKYFATPFVQYHPANKLYENCPLSNVEECTRYPLNRIRFKEHDEDFFVDMHIYNKVGLSSRKRSKPFKLPSEVRLGHGVVIDLDPEISSFENDVDFQIHNSTACLFWKGNSYHQKVSLFAGLGLTPNSTDVIPFRRIFDNRYCFSNVSLLPNTKYFSVIRVYSAGASSYAVSDSVTVIDISTMNKRLQIHNGIGCNEIDIVRPINIISNNSTSVYEYNNLVVSETYTLFVQGNNRGNDMNSSIYFRGFIKSEESDRDLFQVVELISTSKNATITLERFNLSNLEAVLRKCNFNRKVILNKNSLSFHWTHSREKDDYPTHFEVSVAKITQSGMQIMQSEISQVENITFRNLSLETDAKYCGVVKSCFSKYCSKAAFGSVVRLFSTGFNFTIRADMHEDHDNFIIDIEIKDEAKVISNGISRWMLSEDKKGKKRTTSWIFFPDKNTTKASVTIPRTQMLVTIPRYACIQHTYNSWMSPIQCNLIQNTFLFRSNEINIYLVDVNNPDLQKMRVMSHSRNLGANILLFENGNLRFASSRAKLAGIIVGYEGFEFDVYLMMRNAIPKNIEQCHSDTKCLYYAHAKYGFVAFPGLHLHHGDELFLCIRSQNMSSANSGDVSEVIELCSTGLRINDMPPSTVNIDITNAVNDYIAEVSKLDLHWNVPHLSVPILEYKYCVGTSPGLDDVLPFTSSYEENEITILNITLLPGSSYFASVKAIDRSGLESLSSSAFFTVDITPPTPGNFVIRYRRENAVKTIADIIPVELDNFEDPESGIDQFTIRINGHRESYMSNLIVENGNYYIRMKEHMKDGHRYSATVLVSNRAGLTTEIESNVFFIDNSPPTVGIVFDGKEIGKDVDYQLETRMIYASWDFFSDRHSEIAFYRVGLGTSKWMADVITSINVGLTKNFTWEGPFDVGRKYYVFLEACNKVMLCSQAHSDGILLDKTPPISGIVRIGHSNHESFTPDSTSLALQWVGFEDPESDIHYFEWCLGSNANECDIRERENVLLSNQIFKSNLLLPVNVPLYASVFAYNNIGLYSTSTSRKFSVDITPPVEKTNPVFLSHETDEEAFEYQFDNSFFKLKWKFEENESSIMDITIVLKNAREGDDIFYLAVKGNIDTTNIAIPRKHRLRNGDTVVGIVTACNIAKLCTTASTRPIIVDSSRPNQGSFSNPLTWKLIGDMYMFHVNWYGFSDDESAISSYYLTADRTYSGSELTGGPIKISGNKSSISIPISATAWSLKEAVILTIWAVNGAGLTSLSSKVTIQSQPTTKASVSGQFYIQRHSCSLHYCNNDCTCSVVGKKCTHSISAKKQCKSSVNTVKILDENILIRNSVKPAKLLSSSNCISLQFDNMNLSMIESVLRFEWSVALLNEDPGLGFYDEEEYPWRDIGMRMTDTECLPRHKELENGASYVVYIRIWISEDNYLTRYSEPFKVDTTAPFVKMGRYIKTYLKTHKGDQNVRFITDMDDFICTTWDDVFSDGKGNITGYHLMIGSQSKADDVQRRKWVGNMKEMCFATANFTAGLDYVFSVTAEDETGMTTTLDSTPFKIDGIPPTTGKVFNTDSFRDKLYSSSTTSLGVSWHGFKDDVSHIFKYECRVRFENGSFITGQMFRNVGYENSVIIDNISLKHGEIYVIDVRAMDGAGLFSDVISSHPVKVDSTPPAAFLCEANKTKRLNWIVQASAAEFTVYLESNSSYTFTFMLKAGHSKEFVLFIDNKTETLYFDDTEGVYMLSEYRLFSMHSRQEHVKLISRSQNDIPSDDLNIDVIKCNLMDTYEDGAVEIKQIRPSLVKVETHFFDMESGIKTLNVNIGTTHCGHQMFSNIPMHAHFKFFDVFVPHNTTVFASATVTNGAGVSRVFCSKALVVDFTPPKLVNLTINTEYFHYNKSTRARVMGSFLVSDDESGVQNCDFGIGSNPSSVNIQPWTPIEVTEAYFISNEFDVFHEMHVFGKIQCRNTIGLYHEEAFDPIEVALAPPDSSQASIAVVTDKCSHSVPVVSDKNSLVLHWEGFSDTIHLRKFDYRVLFHRTALSPWISVEECDYAAMNKLNMNDGKMYTAEVKAFTSFQNGSTSAYQTFIVETRAPTITGEPPTVSRQGDYVIVDWTAVFKTQSGLNMAFDVKVGSRYYFSDLLRLVNVQRSQVKAELPESSKVLSIFLSIRAHICTEQSSIYYGMHALTGI